MIYEVHLPNVGEGILDGEVVKWLVKEGEDVKENQPVIEIITDKVNVEIPSPKSGTVLRLVVKEGEVVRVGQLLLILGKKGEQLEPAQTAISPGVLASGVSVTPVQKRSQDVLASPATRRLALNLEVDLTMVKGTGPAGRITDDDVRQFKESATLSPATSTVSPLEERIPIRGIRRKIAEHMVQSEHTAPHVTHVDEVDVTRIVQLREEAKQSKSGVRLTYLPFIIKALIPALKQYPYLNASLDETKGEIILKKYYNIGIATDTEQGLVVPVVTNADQKSLTQLAEEVERLSQRARTGQLTLDEIKDSTFTISNVGSFGGMFTTPIINYPEVAILGVHKITKRPAVQDNQVIIRDMTYLSVSFDHRVLDGAMAAKFMTAIKKNIEDPKPVDFKLE